MDHSKSTFLSGQAEDCGFFFFSKEMDSAVETDGPDSVFIFYDCDDVDDPYGRFDTDIANWTAISCALTRPAGLKRIIVSISPQGDFLEFDCNKWGADTGIIPGLPSNLRKLATINNTIYACGMGRAVLVRHGLNDWESIGPGEREGDPAVVGFEAMAGLSEDEIYAVGWNGEIWCRDNGQWRQLASPTRNILSAICCGEDGFLYAVGHAGTLLKGRGDQWEAIDTGRADNLKDVAARNGKIYVVSDFEILVLGADGLVPDADFADEDRPATCLHLLPAKDGLISMGPKDVFVKQDGAQWQRLV